MNKLKNFLKHSGLVAALVVAPYSLASELTVPNQFSSGDVTSASDVNANFAAIEAAVNDNHARIQEGLQSQSRPVFVGFSEPVDGVSGFNSWQQACHNTSAGSHICSDVELAEAPYNPEAPIPNEEAAWINVEIQDVSFKSGTSSVMIKNQRIQGCTTSGVSYAISSSGVSSGGSCNQTRPVACCK